MFQNKTRPNQACEITKACLFKGTRVIKTTINTIQTVVENQGAETKDNSSQSNKIYI